MVVWWPLVAVMMVVVVVSGGAIDVNDRGSGRNCSERLRTASSNDKGRRGADREMISARTGLVTRHGLAEQRLLRGGVGARVGHAGADHGVRGEVRLEVSGRLLASTAPRSAEPSAPMLAKYSNAATLLPQTSPMAPWSRV